jgi:putative membrane protein
VQSSLFAFLHHVAVFTLAASTAIEFVLLRGKLTLGAMKVLPRVDLVLGVSAGAALVIGLLRIFYFEKGPAYYFHSAPFVTKLVLFAIVGLLSIYPTRAIVSLRKEVQAGRTPELASPKLSSLRKVIGLELAGIVGILLCAAMAAKGVGAGA